MKIERISTSPAEEKMREFFRAQAQLNRADLDYIALVAGVELPSEDAEAIAEEDSIEKEATNEQ